MTRSYRSALHRAGNTTSTTKSFPGERRVATRASRENVESSNPRFSLKASVYALLLAMGGVGYLNVASATSITVLKDSGKTGAASCVANEGSADATGKLDWSCVVKGQAGSVGMLSERGDRDGPSISLLPYRLREDSVAIGRNAVITEGRAGVAIGADSNVSSVQGIAIGENANVRTQIGGYTEDRRLGVDPFVGGGIAIGANTIAENPGDVVIGEDAARWNGRIVGYGSSVILGAGAGTGTGTASDDRAHFGAAVYLGARAGSSSDGSRNIAVGYGAAHRMKGDRTLAIGYYAFGKESESVNATVEDSIGLGTEVGLSSRGARNILVGKSTGRRLNGNDNIVMGWDSGKGIVGSNNVILGKLATGSDDAANRSSERIDSAVSIGSKSKVRGSNSVAIGPSSLADKAGVAIGTDATATTAGGVAIGKGAVEGAANPFASAAIKGTTYQYAGIAPESVVSVGNAGAERQITNVAAGRISATSTDAINGSQLYAVHQAIENLTVSATNSAGGGSWNLQVNGDTPTAVEPSSTVGLNAGSNIQLARDGNTVSISTTPNIKVESVQADAVTAGTVSATDTLRVTDGPALTREGIDAANKTIVNVADGKKDHDAVNVAQLNQSARNLNERIDSISDGYNSRLNKVVSGLNNRIDRVAADADAGSATAGAIANLPHAHLPGENAFAIATAGYRGQQGYAAGLSRVSENGHWVVKGSLSGNNRGHMMYGAGIAYKW